MKKQVIFIHGGDCFNTYKEYISFLKKRQVDFKRYVSGRRDWKRTSGTSLGKNFEAILPDMPNKLNARYEEWKIWFEKFIPHLRSGVVLVGRSLGGTFLAKYISENTFPKRIKATFLIAPAFITEGSFKVPKTLNKLEKQGGRIFLYQSRDDRVVPFADFEKYRGKLKNVTVRIFKNRGHFNKGKLPELTRDIKAL